MHAFADSLKTFKIVNGVYPSTIEGLNALISNPNPSLYTSYPSEGFIDGKKLPIDP
jgi:hypothetical protein